MSEKKEKNTIGNNNNNFSLGTNWGLSLGLEELDISGSWGELASAAWGHLLGSMGSDARLSRLNMANSSFLGSMFEGKNEIMKVRKKKRIFLKRKEN